MMGADSRRHHTGELSAVLDESLSDADTPNGNHPTHELDDTEIETLAQQQEQSRRAFDAVLEKSSQQWRAETDPKVLSDALVTILDQIRGPALTRVGPHTHTDQSSHPEHDAPLAARNGDGDQDVNMEKYDDASDALLEQHQNGHAVSDDRLTSSIAIRAKYIPLRLSQSERKILRLVEAALKVSEYTDVVDVLATSRMKTRQRIHAQIRDLCSILTGLAVAMDYNKGQKLVKDRDFADNQAFFQAAFEIARRHKVANPEKSRDTYGKLIHMLQDSVNNEIERLLEFSCVKPLVTVTSYLEERGGLELLDDPLIEKATAEIIPDGKSRRTVQREIQAKEHAVSVLAKRYKNGRMLDEDEVRRCLYSIGDNNAYLRAARDPCDMMIKYLHSYFKPERPADKRDSIAITEGVAGARLTHDHVRQFRYVFQSLALWREVCHEMYRLWYLSEKDLLDSKNPYHLRNTGQGLNRVQAAPSVSRAMYEILNTVQRRVGRWVGSSVVHLGDYNVPNALTFIDKYAQVQRILGPLTTCIRRIGEIAADDKSIHKYITDTFGGVEPARKLILRDFFRHAFDGSGASDWFSAGSCIDGRLTSAWNWCSDIEKKTYWPLFLLTGFTGFDGDF
eukprot:TRINITY_DN513_c0_g2_i1.p1 TRINITY_DN513_c0_g2~~TRINITY_DN513_c0_g2_i1.p1  ORF type:complete len:621 (+),score=90.01 TRINITY_DN513_c0_g2_i1:91-1953(+)